MSPILALAFLVPHVRAAAPPPGILRPVVGEKMAEAAGSSVAAPVALPTRPSYALAVGESYRYRFEHESKVRQSELVRIAIVKVARNGNAQVTVEIAAPPEGTAAPTWSVPVRFEVDRWFSRVGKSSESSYDFEPLLRLEKPGLRPTGTYSYVPGEAGSGVYEVRDTQADGLAFQWRKTQVLSAKGLPVSAESRSEFEDGDSIVRTLTRLED